MCTRPTKRVRAIAKNRFRAWYASQICVCFPLPRDQTPVKCRRSTTGTALLNTAVRRADRIIDAVLDRFDFQRYQLSFIVSNGYYVFICFTPPSSFVRQLRIDGDQRKRHHVTMWRYVLNTTKRARDVIVSRIDNFFFLSHRHHRNFIKGNKVIFKLKITSSFKRVGRTSSSNVDLVKRPVCGISTEVNICMRYYTLS